MSKRSDSLDWSRALNASAKWATFNKQNWRCGMNQSDVIKGVAAAVSTEALDASPGGAAAGADLGGSSKYSNENFED